MSAVGLTDDPGAAESSPLTLFLSGDVMPGRGIDQVLPHPSAPRLHEPYVVHAGDYVSLAEKKNGPLPRPLDYAYIWGDALGILDRVSPDVRIINLETAITTSDAYWQGKGINYRMNPGNTPCLTAAGIDCCVLANNHVLDWGYPGLIDTLDALRTAGIVTAGAGATLKEAQAPASLDVTGKGRVQIFSFGHDSSGIPPAWAATDKRAGIALLDKLSDSAVAEIAAMVHEVKRPGSIVIASIHWGGNWGYTVPQEQQRFAHRLIDEAAIDVVHGHSSHHPRGIEVYRDRPIIYGCGDLLNDYEGISGHQEYRGELGLMYFPTLDPSSGKLVRFELIPILIRKFRLNRPPEQDIRWMAELLNREGERFGTHAEFTDGEALRLFW